MFQQAMQRIRMPIDGLFARLTRRRNDVGYVPTYARSLAGPVITADNMSDDPTVEACLRYIANTTAILPWHVFLKTENGSEVQEKHRCDWLLNKRPSREWSAFQFRETMSRWALKYGNAFAEIERDNNGNPFALWPIKPDRVTTCRRENGDLYYEVDVDQGNRVEIDFMDMFHIRGFGDGPVGISIVEHAKETLGWARAAQMFGSSFFGNGTNVSGIVVHKKKLTENGLKRAKAEMDQLYKGVRNSHKTAHFDTDADFKKIGLDAKETQMIETQIFLVEHICRLFGVPPHKVMHLYRATFNNIEHQAIEVVVDCIHPWVKRFEDEADFKLFGEQNRRGYFTKINMKALLRGDSAAQATFLRAMFSMGVYSPNDIREFLDENGIGTDGDKHLVQLNLTTLEKAGEQPPTQQPASASSDMPDDADTPEAQAAVDRINKLMAEAA